MKGITLYIILSIILFNLIFYSCDKSNQGTVSIESISLERLTENFLDYRIHHEQVFSDGYKEKMFIDRINDELDTSTIDFYINKDLFLFNELIPAQENLWQLHKTKKYITFTRQCNHYSDFVFDSVFYQNILIDTVGLIVTFKVTANDGLKLETSTEE